MSNHSSDTPKCLAGSPNGFLCTREENHGGSYHIAKTDEWRDGKQVVIDRWLIVRDYEDYEPGDVDGPRATPI